MILLPAEEEEATLGARPDKVRPGDRMRAFLKWKVVGFFLTWASLSPAAAPRARRNRTGSIL
jgi:hypothetical protein